MPSRKIICILVLIPLAISFYFLGRGPLRKTAPHNESGASVAATTPSQIPENEPLETPPKQSLAEALLARTPKAEPSLDPRITRYTDGSADYVSAIETSKKLHQNESSHEDLTLLSQLFTQYRVFYQKNPVGVENFEFTAALAGNNPQKINFIDPNSPALVNNELVDRWGSPFVFHPLSGTNMELRSLGPDQTLWTEDDLTFNTPSEQP